MTEAKSDDGDNPTISTVYNLQTGCIVTITAKNLSPAMAFAFKGAIDLLGKMVQFGDNIEHKLRQAEQLAWGEIFQLSCLVVRLNNDDQGGNGAKPGPETGHHTSGVTCGLARILSVFTSCTGVSVTVSPPEESPGDS